MEIIDVNRNTLSNLYEQYPESFKDLGLNGNYLTYNGEEVDISNFNINDLLDGNNQFGPSLSVLSSEDIFRIIRVHAVMLDSSLNNEKSQNDNKIEIIKRENPLMRNISIVHKNGINGDIDYINIVDSTGRDHLFRNDRNVDVFQIYEILKAENPGRDITPDELCSAIDRKLHMVQMQQAENIIDKSTTSEDFSNKMKRVNDPYKDDKMHSVYGNEDDDIAIVADLSSSEGHKVVTFDKNEFGDLVIENHDQNVNSQESVAVNGSEEENLGVSNSIGSEISTDVELNDNVNKEQITLISPEEFYRLLNSSEELTPEQRKQVDLYYAYLGDLIIYEDYLVPELHTMLNEFRAYVYELEFGDHDPDSPINSKQQEAIQKNEEMEAKKAEDMGTTTLEKAEDNVKKLELIRTNQLGDSTGNVSTIQVIAFIVGVAIILTAVTLYLIG